MRLRLEPVPSPPPGELLHCVLGVPITKLLRASQWPQVVVSGHPCLPLVHAQMGDEPKDWWAEWWAVGPYKFSSPSPFPPLQLYLCHCYFIHPPGLDCLSPSFSNRTLWFPWVTKPSRIMTVFPSPLAIMFNEILAEMSYGHTQEQSTINNWHVFIPFYPVPSSSCCLEGRCIITTEALASFSDAENETTC